MEYTNDQHEDEMSGSHNLNHCLKEFAGSSDLSYEQLSEVLNEIDSLPPPPQLRSDVHPLHKWSKAPPGTPGITSLDLRIYQASIDLYFRLSNHVDKPKVHGLPGLDLAAIIEEDFERFGNKWKRSDWLPIRESTNTIAEAYLRHLATTKEMVWSKDMYKTTYFMVSVLRSLQDTLQDIPVSGSGFINITTSRFDLDIADVETVGVIKKLKAILKKMSLTQQSKTFLGDNFMSIVDNTASARPPIMAIANPKGLKLILEMKLNSTKKTVFFAPIGVACRS